MGYVYAFLGIGAAVVAVYTLALIIDPRYPTDPPHTTER